MGELGAFLKIQRADPVERRWNIGPQYHKRCGPP